MAQTPSDTQNAYHSSKFYEICLQGHLDAQWTDWFDGLSISLEGNGITRLTGQIADQAALYGLLAKIRDLGIPLISLTSTSSQPKSLTPESLTSDNLKNGENKP